MDFTEFDNFTNVSTTNMTVLTNRLSNRESQILQLMSNGLTSKEIGQKLFISNLTVDKHKRNMLSKFNARNSVQLVLWADRQGLLQEVYTQ